MSPQPTPDPLEQARTMWADDPGSRALGMALLELGPGRAAVAMTVRPDMVNGYRVCTPRELQASANALSASAATSPPWQTR